jgi:hypothetical protein
MVSEADEEDDDDSLIEVETSAVLEAMVALLREACTCVVDCTESLVGNEVGEVVLLDDWGSSDCCDSITVNEVLKMDESVEDDGSSDCCVSIPVSAVLLIDDSVEDDGTADGWDSIPWGGVLVGKGKSVDDPDRLDVDSEGCAMMINDGSWVDTDEVETSTWEVSEGGPSLIAVSMNRKEVVEGGPSEEEDSVSEPIAVGAAEEGAWAGGISPSPSPATVIEVHHIELSDLKASGLGRFRSPAM